MQETRTPVWPARNLTAETIQPGDRIAVTLPEGSYPFEVRNAGPEGDRVALVLDEIATAHTRSPRTVEVVVDLDTPLAALAAHFGTCHECGRLSPCPDELAERRLERLWRDEPDSHPAHLQEVTGATEGDPAVPDGDEPPRLAVTSPDRPAHPAA